MMESSRSLQQMQYPNNGPSNKQAFSSPSNQQHLQHDFNNQGSASPPASPADASFLHRLSTDATHAVSDVYSSWILGDDAGKSVRFPFCLRQGMLGMTFIEINGRAYVQSVTPLSEAAAAGILPQDAVQYAALRERNGSDSETSDEVLCQHVLDAEEKGMRISYDNLRSLVTPLNPSQSAFLSPPTKSSLPFGQDHPEIPTNVCVPSHKRRNGLNHGSANGTLHENSTSDPNDLPILILCFRRTRQRKVGVAPVSAFSFRLDDECDFATQLVQRLAPTQDMEMPTPDTWQELVHDGTDWLLGNGSMLPPQGSNGHNHHIPGEDDLTIPLDPMEKERSRKLAQLRSRMAAEAMLKQQQQLENAEDRTEDVEAVTIRGMIQKAVGLAFVRSSKVVLGVSVHAGSGIVLARLSDGTWSAPSAIGTWGIGLGLQFGLEVAEYIFILQTNEALDHFRRGGSFTVGGNVGAAVAGVGREAYGAASVGGTVCGSTSTVKDDEYNHAQSDMEVQPSLAIAPIVAYAKSQGLYIGVSLEGSRIFTRDDLNRRAYKFNAGRDVVASDILSGKVGTPPEAEELYAALHSVEFTHEMSCLPRPPEILRSNSQHPWRYQTCTMSQSNTPFSFLSSLTPDEVEACSTFETQFKAFMYGGVSVQRVIPEKNGVSRTAKERRTLWLMLPEVGSLRLGFVSKLSDGEGIISNRNSTHRAQRADSRSGLMGDHDTVGSEEVTLDSALKDGNGTISSNIPNVRRHNVQLSRKHSVGLSDVTLLTQEPKVNIRFKGEDKMEHLRIISIQDVGGTQLLFLANNFREAELLVCGLKLLLERETSRLAMRGGIPRHSFGRGGLLQTAATAARQRRFDHHSDTESVSVASNLPDDRTWGDVPGRDYMRQAASLQENGLPQYRHGQTIERRIAERVSLPLPLPLCRVLLLDSTSPVVKAWEKDRGDTGFQKTRWTFPPSAQRELERHSSEHQLIASGSMCDAHRTVNFERARYGAIVHLSETHTVESDNARELVLAVIERNPRRGFSIKVRVILRAVQDKRCEASVSASIRPVGKDMSNQAAVHKAFLLVTDEIKERYGMEGSGLLSGFLQVVDDMASEGKKKKERTPSSEASVGSNRSKSGSSPRSPSSRNHDPYPMPASSSGRSPRQAQVTLPAPTVQTRPAKANSKSASKESGLVSFDNMLQTGRESPETTNSARPSTPSLLNQVPEADPSKRLQVKPTVVLKSDEFDLPPRNANTSPQTEPESDPVLIEVKPLPKIRLSLMPSPREEDEDMQSTDSPVDSSSKRKKKKKKKKEKRSSSGSGRRREKSLF